MEAVKVYNNNAVSAVQPDGREVVLVGSGVGFAKKPGDTIDERKIEKTYYIQSEFQTKFLQLMKDAGPDAIRAAEDILKYARGKGLELKDQLLVSLIDHICFAIRRAESGMGFTNALHTEVRLFYPQEYNIGCHALTEIQRRFNVTLPQDEAASIALHLVNAEHEMSLGITLKVTQALGQMLHTLESNDKFHLDRTTIYYDELVIHLKFLALDLYSPRDTLPADEQFSDLIMQAFPQDYHLAEILTKELETACGKELSKEQKAYLAVHLHRINKGKEGVKEHGTI